MKIFLKKLLYELVVWGKPFVRTKIQQDLVPLIQVEIGKLPIDVPLKDALFNSVKIRIDDFCKKLL